MAQQAAKTIFERYDISKKGCPFEIINATNLETKTAISPPKNVAPPPPPPPPPVPQPKVSEDMEVQEIEIVLADFKKRMAGIDKEKLLPPKLLPNGNYCFYKEGKWGFQSINTDDFISPIFDFVEIDERLGGFVGYQDGLANYYDETGKKQLSDDYFFVKIVEKGVFIVQTATGYGILKDEKVIIEPKEKKITVHRRDGYYTFRITSKDDTQYFLANDHETKSNIDSRHGIEPVGKNYEVAYNEIYDLKNKRKLLCEDGFKVRILDSKKGLLSIRKNKEKYCHLIDLKGNIISDKDFINLDTFNQKGLAVAGIHNLSSPKDNPSYLYGMIDFKGNWVVQPEYSGINKLYDYYFVRRIGTSFRGVMSEDGRLIIPADYQNLKFLDNDKMFCQKRKDGRIYAQIFNLKNGQLLEDSLRIQDMQLFDLCGKELYLTEMAGYYYGNAYWTFLDKNMQSIGVIANKFDAKDELFVGTRTHIKKGLGGAKVYDCDGQQLSFTLEGMQQDSFQKAMVINSNWVYVLTEKNNSFLVSRNGEAKEVYEDFMKVWDARIEAWRMLKTYVPDVTIVVDENMNPIIAPYFRDIDSFSPRTELMKVKTPNYKFGLIDTDGNLLTGQLYSEINYLGHGYREVSKGSSWYKKVGVMDKYGNVVIPIKFPDRGVSYNFDGRWRFLDNFRWKKDLF